MPRATARAPRRRPRRRRRASGWSGRMLGDQHLDAGRPAVRPHPGHCVQASWVRPSSRAVVPSPRGNTSARNMPGPAARRTSPMSGHPQERSDARVGRSPGSTRVAPRDARWPFSSRSCKRRPRRTSLGSRRTDPPAPRPGPAPAGGSRCGATAPRPWWTTRLPVARAAAPARAGPSPHLAGQDIHQRDAPVGQCWSNRGGDVPERGWQMAGRKAEKQDPAAGDVEDQPQ